MQGSPGSVHSPDMKNASIAGRLAVFLCACLALATAPLGRPADHELHYKLFMDKSQTGWMRLTQSTDEGKITTTREIHFSFKRGKSESSAEMSTTFVETADGKPVSMRALQRMGTDPVVTEYTFTDKGVQSVNSPDGDRVVTMLPAPTGDWLTPAAGAEFLAKRLRGGATSVSFRTIDPLSGPDVITVTYSEIRADSVKVGDRTIEGFRMKSAVSNAPGVLGDDFVDKAGLLVTQQASMGGMKVDLEVAGPEVMTQVRASPEMMVSTFVRPDKAVVDPLRVSVGTFTLDFVEEDAPILPETGSQTVTSVRGTKATVTIDASFPHPAPEADKDNPAFLEASAMVTCKDSRVKGIAEAGVKGIDPDDVLERARALRRTVYKHISTKNLDVGFAAAAEVARTRKGDCTEHAVLLTAVLRAAGIPSRIAGGLIFAEQFAGAKGIFGYHMWSQALITVDGSARWIDLDATLSLEPGYDATHIALMTSALSDTQGTQDLLAIAVAMGRVKISVVNVEHRR